MHIFNTFQSDPYLRNPASLQHTHTYEELKGLDSRQGILPHVKSVDQFELLSGEDDVPA